MAERARGQASGGWLRSVARRVKDWARAVLSEEEADFAAALAQARLAPERVRPATSGLPITVPRGPPLPPASIKMVTAPAVSVGPPEHWLRDAQARRAMGPPADWVARVRKVAPHLVEGMTDETPPPPLSEAHLSARARMMLSGNTTDAEPRRSLPPSAMVPSVRTRPSPPRLSRRVESSATAENGREGGIAPSPGGSSRASASEVATPVGARTSSSWAHPFASPPHAPIPSEPAPLPVEGPTTPVPLMLRGAPFPHPVRVESTPVSPSEVCVPPLGELDSDDGLSSSGLPHGISASRAFGVQRPVSTSVAAPRARSTAELWIPRRPTRETVPVYAEPVHREQYIASGLRTAPGRTETWPGESGQGGARQAAYPVEEEAGQPSSSSRDTDDADAAHELRLWERMRRLEREHRGE
ncbi:hypothetical protein LXT21_13095 [Myxococcus sp. K38C18041901]|uniref:hypothetical protein n=1 Tax=Myxococcus guangdongensis TaxID=2906760 RepID=UPI0020A7043C|nr:hypothetical protein [Myxococcus guangdongensis]MCP3059716.1 hypothetical protein [Myxococcus guangdongensis]